MKKYILIATLPFLFACNPAEKEVSSLQDSISKLTIAAENQLGEKNALINNQEVVINEFLKSYNEISNNLANIRAKEKIVTISANRTELKKSVKAQIISDIQAIYDLLGKNKAKVTELNNKLIQANILAEDLSKAVGNLAVSVYEKETEVKALQSKLEKMNIDFRTLQLRYYDLSEKSAMQRMEMNTGYYAIGTTKDLQKQGVVTREGGFIGIGKSTEINPKISENYLTKVDVTLATEIPIVTKKARLVTNHPEGSYEFYKEDGSIQKLLILDREKFWLLSKYLVITTDN